MAPYLGAGILKCSQRVRYYDVPPEESYYEGDSGGYGYNLVYIGSVMVRTGYDSNEGCFETIRASAINSPQATVMFADTARARTDKSSNLQIVQYPFAEPPYYVVNGEPQPVQFARPSLHFRHGGRADIGWADGHVSDEKMARCEQPSFDVELAAEFEIGWFAPVDNSLFDLR